MPDSTTVPMTAEEWQRAEHVMHDRARLAALSSDIAFALTQPAELSDVLLRCAQAVVDRLDAAFARIWTLNPSTQILELQASAGMYTHTNGPHGRVAVGTLKIGKIAEERKPHLTNH